MELHALLQVVRERWKSITILTLLSTALAVVIVLSEAPTYSAQSTMYVSARADQNNAASAYQASLLSQQQVRSYAELVRSTRVLSGVSESLGINLSTRQLANRLSATVVPETALLTVTATGPTPAAAQQLANAVTNRFVSVLPSLEGATTGGNPPVVVSVVSYAALPSAPVSPRPLLTIGLGLVLGLLAGVGLAATRHALDNTVKTVPQAEEIAEAPVLGTVPVDSSAHRHPVALYEGQQGRRAEALRKISASLRFMDVERRHSVLLVTSPCPEEGKSTTACNLALTLALSGRNVILVDADLRRSQVATYLGLPSGVGLTNVLVGSATLEEATQPWAHNLFSVLTSGLIPPNPSEMLGSSRMRDLVARLRAEYDDVIIDAAPVLPVADATVAAAACDGVVMVARHGKTRRDQLQQAVATIRTTETPILGVVLNRTPIRDTPMGYYYTSRPASSRDPEPRSWADAPVSVEGARVS